MLKKLLLITLFTLSISPIKAQEDYKKYSESYHINNILQQYSKKLELKANQFQFFKRTLIECNNELSKFESPLTKEDKSKINKVVKEEFIKIYNLLDVEQQKKYKKIKKEIEPYKNFKI